MRESDKTEATKSGRATVFAATTFPEPIASLIKAELTETGETPAGFLRRVVAAYYDVATPIVERGGYRRGKRRETPQE